MPAFSGILNDNGLENKIMLFFDFGKNTPYTTDFFIDNNRSDATIEYDTCTIDDVKYDYKIKKYDDDGEILILGREKTNVFYCLCPWFLRPRFFLLTNKQEL